MEEGNKKLDLNLEFVEDLESITDLKLRVQPFTFNRWWIDVGDFQI